MKRLTLLMTPRTQIICSSKEEENSAIVLIELNLYKDVTLNKGICKYGTRKARRAQGNKSKIRN